MACGEVRELKQNSVIGCFCHEPFATQLAFYFGYQLLLPKELLQQVLIPSDRNARQTCGTDSSGFEKRLQKHDWKHHK